MSIALEIVKQRVHVLLELFAKPGITNKRVLDTLFKNSAVRGNLSYYSSELGLRPELYGTNTTEIF